MACVFEDTLSGGGEGDLKGPRLGERFRIFYRCSVTERVAGTGQQLGDVQRFSAAPEMLLGVKIGGIDDQCLAFPLADGIAKPLPDAGWGMGSVRADDAGVVDHFAQEQEIVRGLNELVVAVVEMGSNRRGGVGEAALGEAEVRGPLRIVTFCRELGCQLLGRR